MIISNEIKKILNIDKWQKAGYTGKGVKIRVLDRLYTGKMFGRGTIPCAAGRKHGEDCVNIIRAIAPDAEITLKNYQNKNIWKKDEFVNIISASVDGFTTTADDFFMRKVQKEHGTICITSAGNKGLFGLTMLAKRNSVISVGAKHLNLETGEITIPDYSSRGKALDTYSFSNHIAEDGNRRLIGTSFAAPVFVGLIALYSQKYFERNGKYPNQEQIQKLLGDEPSLFVLPKLEEEVVVEVDWSKDALKWSKENEISDNTRLEENITRREVITLLYRVAMWIVKKK